MELVKFIVWQVEIGANGTRHLQGYFVVNEKQGDKGRVTPKFVKDKINGSMHFEKRMGTHRQAIEYCTKTDTRKAGPWTLGEHVDEIANKKAAGEKKQNSLQVVKDAIDNGVSMQDLWDDHYNMMCRYSKSFKEYSHLKLQSKERVAPMNFVFWGPPGTGKTHKVIQSIKRLGLTAFWYRPGVNGAWFDGYDPLVHDCVVFDEFKGIFFFFFFFFFFNHGVLSKPPCPRASLCLQK